MAKRNEQDRPRTSVIVHPPVVALLFIVAAYFLGRFIPLPFAVPTFLRYIGFALTLVGFLLGVSSLIEFRRAQTTLDPHGSTSQLVTNGIYRFSRNPIYLGFLLSVIGLPLYLHSYWGIVISPVFILLMNHLIIQHEEAYLMKKFGELYSTYTSQVRRWV